MLSKYQQLPTIMFDEIDTRVLDLPLGDAVLELNINHRHAIDGVDVYKVKVKEDSYRYYDAWLKKEMTKQLKILL